MNLSLRLVEQDEETNHFKTISHGLQFTDDLSQLSKVLN